MHLIRLQWTVLDRRFPSLTVHNFDLKTKADSRVLYFASVNDSANKYLI
jgi:hypothetical protein